MNGQQRPDVAKVLGGLRDFQRRTVDHVFARMYGDANPTRRFLIADEVGLGKTLVARGLIARAVDKLWDEVDRIDVIYICSNADIARQNINRLAIGTDEDFSLATRITLLPLQIKDLKGRKLNFISFTPNTSFDLKSSLGMVDERVLLVDLLRRAWGDRGVAPLNVMRGYTGAERFRSYVQGFDPDRVDETLANSFVAALADEDAALHAAGKPTLRRRFEALCAAYTRADSAPADAVVRERSAWVGDLRGLLARTCLHALEPDLIIMDEFQRFKHLLDDAGEDGELARRLFNYTDQHSQARVILLSATPYKMYTLDDEGAAQGGDDHYRDFLRTIRFLLGDDDARTAEVENLIARYRAALYRLGSGDAGAAQSAKCALEQALRQVMVRTERLAATPDRDGMLTEVQSIPPTLTAADVHTYLGLEQIAGEVGADRALEFWKSAAFPLNFMDDYKFKTSFKDGCQDPVQAPRLASILSTHPGLLISNSDLERYRKIDPGNARLRAMQADMLDNGAWRLLWVPPAMPSYQLAGPYADPALATFTKRLIFSAWRVVPKAIASLLSYEAERRMILSYEPKAVNTEESRKRRRGLLRFARSEGRLTGLPNLTLIYPSPALAELGDILVAPVLYADGRLPTLAEAERFVLGRMTQHLAALAPLAGTTGPVDERWYWLAPLLLDWLRSIEKTRAWWADDDLAAAWTNQDDEDDAVEDATRFFDHIAEAQRLLFAVEAGEQLGPQPPDLAAVLARCALASPATVALRALARVSGCTLTDVDLRDSAAGIGYAFLSLFNRPESMALIRGLNGEEPYWRRVLDYCAAGGLSAVLDEHMHVLRESMGIAEPGAERIDELANELVNVLELKSSTPEFDVIGLSTSGSLAGDRRKLRAHFAMRFGDESTEGSAEPTRADRVRKAFNSPFWPFVLASTSVGQEGLDFHPYCHAVVHWNLPANPVDLEQREGRVHRYKGHAVRKNLARGYGLTADGGPPTADSTAGLVDPWARAFEAARRAQPEGSSDMVPYWVLPTPGGATIERHVPALPLSRDQAQYKSLQSSLAVYRLVFGQSRQEDLLAYLSRSVPAEQLKAAQDVLRIDLSPI